MDYERLHRMIERQQAVVGYFEYRDAMNDKVHIDTVRESPITVAANDVLTYLNQLMYTSDRLSAVEKAG